MSINALDGLAPLGSGGDGSITVIEDFERGDISPYGGDTPAFNVQTGTVIEGSQTVEATGVTTEQIISSTSGLPTYPTQGDTWKWDIQFNDVSSGAAWLIWATQNETATPGGYAIELVPFDDGFNLIVLDGSGGATSPQQKNVSESYTANETYTVEISWGTDNSISSHIVDSSGTQIASLSGSDSTYTSGGIGFLHNHGSTNGSTFYDYGRKV